MSGLTGNASFWAFAAGFNGGYTGALLMGVTPGPTRVTVNWGSTGPNGANPLVETFWPEPDGQIYLPSTNGLRLYDDGTFFARVTATFADGTTSVEVMQISINLNETTALHRSGNGRDDLIVGGFGNDLFYGRTGDDMLVGGFGSDRLYGGDGNDTLYGDNVGDAAGADSLYGDGGNDKIYGGGGNDLLSGGDGNDELYGEAGNDDLRGGAGNDLIVGGSGADRFEGGTGTDTLVSEADGEMDIFVYRTRTEGTDRIFGFETGIDKIELSFLSASAMSASRFVRSVNDMTDTGPYIIYTPGGTLYVDINGTADVGRTTIATFDRGTPIAFTDFLFG